MKTDYGAHEKAYQRLRRDSKVGWGADSFSKRMEGWQRTLTHAQAQSYFPRPGSKVLEIGCGSGDVSLALAKLGYQISGMDISQTAINWAKEKYTSIQPNADFRVGSVCTLPWDENYFDLVIDGNCLHCIIGNDRTQAFSEVRRTLTDNGLFIISAMVNDPKDALGAQGFDHASRCQITSEGIALRYMPRAQDLLTEIQSNGFEIKCQALVENDWWDHLEIHATLAL